LQSCRRIPAFFIIIFRPSSSSLSVILGYPDGIFY
jgi:hypothetical protein